LENLTKKRLTVLSSVIRQKFGIIVFAGARGVFISLLLMVRLAKLNIGKISFEIMYFNGKILFKNYTYFIESIIWVFENNILQV